MNEYHRSLNRRTPCHLRREIDAEQEAVRRFYLNTCWLGCLKVYCSCRTRRPRRDLGNVIGKHLRDIQQAVS